MKLYNYLLQGIHTEEYMCSCLHIPIDTRIPIYLLKTENTVM